MIRTIRRFLAAPVHLIGLGAVLIAQACLKITRFIEGENNTIFGNCEVDDEQGNDNAD